MPQISEFSLEFTERLDENVDEAFEISPRGVGLALDQHQQVSSLTHDFVSAGVENGDDEDEEESGVDENVFEPETGYIIFDWNVIHTREQALLLGLKADYSSAHSLLRNSLDGQMKGVFLNSLKDEGIRGTITLSNGDFHSDDVDVDEVFEAIESQGVKSGVKVLDIVLDSGNEGFFEIKPGALRGVLAKLGYFRPFEGTEVADFYHELGSSVHMDLNASLAEQSMQAEGHPFAPPQHVPRLLDEFFDNYGRTMDILGVLSVIEFENHIEQSDRIGDVLDSKNHELQETGLTNTYEVLSEISDYSE